MTQGAPKGRYVTAAPLDAAAAAAVASVTWPIERLGEGLGELARRAGLHADGDGPAGAPGSEVALAGWLAAAAGGLGLEAEPVDAPVSEVADLLAKAGPALVVVRQGRATGVVLVLGAAGRNLRVVAPDLSLRTCSREALRATLCWPLEGPVSPLIAPVLDDAGLAGRRRRAVAAAMLADRLAGERVSGVWLVRQPAGASLRRQILGGRIPALAVGVLAFFGLVYASEMSGWALIGRSILDGRLDFGWFAAWSLLLVTLVLFRFAGGALEARIAVEFGRRLKARMLAGALRADPDGVTRAGVGAVIGRVMESQAFENLAFNGGLGVVVAVLELGFAAAALAAGAAGRWHVAILLGFGVALVLLAARFHVRMRRWTTERLDMTHRLIEGMVGHRTRLAQERPGRRDGAEDRQLRRYLDASTPLDRVAVALLAALPSAWLIAALAGLAPAFAAPDAPSPTALAISLGGVLLAQHGLFGVVGGLAGLSRAAIAWTQVSEFATGDARPESEPLGLPPTGSRPGRPLLEARGLHFAYAGAADPVLAGVDLSIAPGERLLLEGGSGGGKSTLTALLCGLRAPDRGALALGGLDRHSLGPAWRRRATAAPQFNDNHLLSGSLAFNLLMGRRWPAEPEDLAEAEALCRELALGDLIDRMPAGLHQPVGETGWQLSHGERSRVFLARALLQGADLTVLDESFGALDPETLRLCLDAATRRTNALIVVAHP